MSFVDREDVIELVTGLINRMWKEVLGVELPPIIRMKYQEAMDRFGIDRPDMRYGLELKDVSDWARTTDATVFKAAVEAGGHVKLISVPGGGTSLTRKALDALTEEAKKFGAKGLAYLKLGGDAGAGKMCGPVAKFISDAKQAELRQIAGANDGDVILFCADKLDICYRVLGELREQIARQLNMIPEGQWKFLWVVDFPSFDYDAATQRTSPSTIPSPRRSTRICRSWTATRPACMPRRTTSCSTASRSAAARSVSTRRIFSPGFSDCWAFRRRKHSGNSPSCSMPCASAPRRTAASPWAWIAS